MLSDKDTYWCEFTVSTDPKNPKGSDIFKYRTYTIIIANDDFTSVTERKNTIIKACIDEIVKWHKKHKYNITSNKEQLSNNILVFTDSKTQVKFKNFKVRRSEYDIL